MLLTCRVFPYQWVISLIVVRGSFMERTSNTKMWRNQAVRLYLLCMWFKLRVAELKGSCEGSCEKQVIESWTCFTEIEHSIEIQAFPWSNLFGWCKKGACSRAFVTVDLKFSVLGVDLNCRKETCRKEDSRGDGWGKQFSSEWIVRALQKKPCWGSFTMGIQRDTQFKQPTWWLWISPMEPSRWQILTVTWISQGW